MSLLIAATSASIADTNVVIGNDKGSGVQMISGLSSSSSSFSPSSSTDSSFCCLADSPRDSATEEESVVTVEGAVMSGGDTAVLTSVVAVEREVTSCGDAAVLTPDDSTPDTLSTASTLLEETVEDDVEAGSALAGVEGRGDDTRAGRAS